MLQLPKDQITALAVDEVRAALRRVLDGAVVSEVDPNLLEAVIAEWGAVSGRGGPEVPCPACGISVEKVHAGEHVPVCPDHPAARELRAFAAAVRGLPELGGTLELELPAPPAELLAALAAGLKELQTSPARWRPGVSAEAGTAALRALLGAAPDEAARARAGEQLSALVRQWERWFHPETDPCASCGGVFGIDDLPQHLAGCERHPARLSLQRGRAALPDPIRATVEEEARLLGERARYRDGLEALLRACEKYDSDMGWGGSCGYSNKWTEAPWRAARVQGEKVVGFVESPPYVKRKPGELSASWPAFAAPVAAALARVVAARPGPGEPIASPADAELLRAAGAELLVLAQRHGRSITCPCCARGAFSVFEIVEHVTGCILHPAVARARGLDEELRVLGPLASGRRPGLVVAAIPGGPEPRLQLLWPKRPDQEDEARLGPGSYGLETLRKDVAKIEFLLDPAKRADSPTLLESYATEVEATLNDWQRYRVASESPCPGCGERFDLPVRPAHVAVCPAHPELRRAEQLEAVLRELRGPVPSALPALRAEADRFRIGLATLLDRCHAFWNSMGDGDRGQSIIHAYLEPGWKMARAEAKALLQAGGPG